MFEGLVAVGKTLLEVLLELKPIPGAAMDDCGITEVRGCVGAGGFTNGCW
jgi:hypothetical protein